MTDLPEWVDGKAFVAWLEGRRPDLREVITESQSRTLYRLRAENGCGSLDVVDRLCVRLNLHINEIPEWIWEVDPPGFGRKAKTYSDETKERALKMIGTGTAIREISKILNVPQATVATWKKRANG